MKKKLWEKTKENLPAFEIEPNPEKLRARIAEDDRKIIALDDDPTGVQTVHGVTVLTEWGKDILTEAFNEDNPLFYILTNSRSLKSEDTKALHREVIRNIIEVSRKTEKDFEIISRGDSTLRGHYPLETEVIRGEIEKGISKPIDGEVIIPFFMEGGRYTIGDVHYVLDGEWLVPAGQTEFAKDTTFGYCSSDLKTWIEEKTNGKYPSDQVMSISLETLRCQGPKAVMDKLMAVCDFGKVIVNAADYRDLEIFVEGLLDAQQRGKRFLYRTAASFVRVRGGIAPRNLLHTKEIVSGPSNRGGLVIVGSHVKKTTQQLQNLMTLNNVTGLEFDVNAVRQNKTNEMVEDIVVRVEKLVKSGNTAVVYTSREVLKISQDQAEKNLEFSVRVSEALVRIVQNLSIQPRFIIAKGGITSSDVGVKGLGVRKATVLGQVLPGIPVWRLGGESKFPGMAYIIFPGNVGGSEALKEVVAKFIEH